MEFFAGEVLRMDIFLDGGIEKGLIIRARYWGLEIPATSEVAVTESPKITLKLPEIRLSHL